MLESVSLMTAAELAAHLRVTVKEVLRSEGEYREAFGAMAVAGGGAHASQSVALEPFTRFAEDMLTEPLSSVQAAALHAQVDVDGDGQLELKDWLRFLAGEVRGKAKLPAPVPTPAPAPAPAPAPVASSPLVPNNKGRKVASLKDMTSKTISE